MSYSVLLVEKEDVSDIYTDELIGKLRARTNLHDGILHTSTLEQHKDFLAKTEYIFSTWGMSKLNEDDIKKYFPSLKCVFYAASSVQYFARPFLKSGMRVFSIWDAMSKPVAEYCVAAIMLANKGFFRLLNHTKTRRDDYWNRSGSGIGNAGAKIGLVGPGRVGRYVANILKNYDFEVYIYSIAMSEAEAANHGAELKDLQWIMKNCDVISNHLADNEGTKKFFGYEQLSLMKDEAFFLNTGLRGQIDEEALVRVLKEKPSVTVLLDCMWPEENEAEHPIYDLKNAFISPTLAGNTGEEKTVMAMEIIDTFYKYLDNKEITTEITLDMLEWMA